MKKKNFLLLASALIFLDQLTKIMFTGKTHMIGQIGIKYTTNLGASFGIMQGGKWLFIAAAIVVIYLTFKFYKSFENKAGLLLILAGAAGNLIDRALFGHVRDFIAIWLWPTFNLADAFSVMGVAILAWQTIKKDKKVL